MPTRKLTSDERVAARRIFDAVRAMINEEAAGDVQLAWALNRKVAKELVYIERGTPAHRRKLKKLVREQQGNRCAIVDHELPIMGAELDRLDTMKGYVEGNVRVVCHGCHRKEQESKKFQG